MNDQFDTDPQSEPLGSDPDTKKDFEPQTRMARKKKYRRQETRGWVFSLAAAVVIALLLRFFVFEFIRVDGSSMEPTLFTNEYVFMEKVTYWFDPPARGDIVICSFPNRTETFVKRVIGTQGDVLEIKDGVLYINGQANYDYYDGVMMSDLSPTTVPQGCVFVMGDNRNNSQDSTSSSVGPLPYNMILGKALFVIWPVDKIHGI